MDKKVNIDFSFLNKTLWLMDKNFVAHGQNMNIDFSFLNNTFCGSWTKNEHRFFEQNFVAHGQKMKIGRGGQNFAGWMTKV